MTHFNNSIAAVETKIEFYDACGAQYLNIP